ncbi:MAG: energy transducer TonB [Candidatus Obscuribacterales bacterium]|nr:energy transducer TonB [Candidatus Obscuribacterales bacterium]
MTKEIDKFYIATPCAMNWDELEGDERVRFCGGCQKNVYNCSELSSKELSDLIIQTEGKFCGRIFRRQDGTIITDDCPLALRRVRNAARKTLKWAAAIASLLLANIPAFSQSPSSKAAKPQQSKKTVIMDSACSKTATPPAQTPKFNSIPGGAAGGLTAGPPPDTPEQLLYKESMISQVNKQWRELMPGTPGPFIRVGLNPEGKVNVVFLSVSSGSRSIDDKAISMVEKMKFPAPPKNGFGIAADVDLHSVQSQLNKSKNKN